MKLSEIKIGSYAKVLELKGQGLDRQHLLNMGLIPGIEIKAVKRAPLGDPLEIMLHGYNLAIRNSQADNVIIEEIDKPNYYNLACNKDCLNCRSICNKKFNSPEYILDRIDNKAAYLKEELLDEVEHPGFGEPGRFHNKNNENPLPSDKDITFALVGNQNSGKTTLFNALTGSNQHVGNFPGVTIDRADGQIKGYPNTKITDLPGIYSLSPYSQEEVISREFILNDDVDCIINIIDATNIERGLYLSMQLLQLEHPMVIALNMMDELASNKGSVLINRLEYALGVPVVPISAVKGQGIEELIEHAMHIAKYQELPLKQDFCSPNEKGGIVHRALHSIMHIIEDHCASPKGSNHRHLIPVRFATEKLAENDHIIFEKLQLNTEDKKAIEAILAQMEREGKKDRSALIAEMRYRYILKVCEECVIKGRPSKQQKRSNIIDKILTGKWTAIPSFIAIMGIIFWLTFNVIGYSLSMLIESGISFLSDICEDTLMTLDISPVFHSLIMDGLFAGVGTVIGFLPIIIVLFFFLSILEDSGYMARVAFFMDKMLRKIGLSGRSIVPMLIGFGCSVPAIMATRTLPSKRDRRLTILLIPYMSCSAKLPVYAFIAAIFFPENAVVVMLFLYVLGILLGIVIALFFKGRSKPVPFIMELPNYRLPGLKNVTLLLWEKSKDFLSRAFTVILIASLVIWFLQSFNFGLELVEDTSESILSSIAGFISPVFDPIGLGDWKLVTSLISGFMMKESVISTMAVLYGSIATIQTSMTPVIAISFLVFCLLYTPCIASISCIRKEVGSFNAFLIVVLQCAVAWVVAFIVFHILMFII